MGDRLIVAIGDGAAERPCDRLRSQGLDCMRLTADEAASLTGLLLEEPRITNMVIWADCGGKWSDGHILAAAKLLQRKGRLILVGTGPLADRLRQYDMVANTEDPGQLPELLTRGVETPEKLDDRIPAHSPAAEKTVKDEPVGPVRPIRIPDTVVVMIDVLGSQSRIGCSTQAIALYHYCKSLGFDPAVVAPEPVITGMAQVTQPTKIDGGYRIEGVDFVIDTARAYDCYIRDLGAAGEPEERSNMVLVAGVKPWELEQTMQAVRGGRGRDMTVMLSFATRRDRDALRPLFGSNAVEMAPWMPDPWHPTNEQLAVYDRLLRNKMLSICKEERNYAL